ncbi:hypothetical protein [Nostoc sp. ChiQUE01b]|uniref:hypothetical protein n=1 Tax=Nostoc sp. ChiQUE01b TaxID=3075376 RepID=UPI002AD45102|nr:hypothetical protein [Nostoc sp. ChiQUE01b]
MYDDSAQGESDDYKNPKSLLDMKCDKLGRHTATPKVDSESAKSYQKMRSFKKCI